MRRSKPLRRALSSTASFVEGSMILESRYGPDAVRDLDLFVAKAQVSLIPVDEDQAEARTTRRSASMARVAMVRGLNFGDCFSYALSKALEMPLLFKGNDFGQTDIDCHPASSAG